MTSPWIVGYPWSVLIKGIRFRKWTSDEEWISRKFLSLTTDVWEAPNSLQKVWTVERVVFKWVRVSTIYRISIGRMALVFSFYLYFNVNVLASVWSSINLAILLPPRPIEFMFCIWLMFKHSIWKIFLLTKMLSGLPVSNQFFQVGYSIVGQMLWWQYYCRIFWLAHIRWYNDNKREMQWKRLQVPFVLLIFC